MTAPNIYGWDLGGAHLKRVVLDASGRVIGARQLACPLWRGLDQLNAAFALVRDPAAEAGASHAVTMTGELCDSFESREHGVRRITAAVVAALGDSQTALYAGPSGWYAPAEIDQASALACASANWHAMAAVTAMRTGNAVLIDVGSTTTDIVAVVDGEVRARGTDDASRLQHDELVYTGVVRTPLMAVTGFAPYRGQVHRIAAEYFANTGDVYRLRGELPADADLQDTADGGDRTPAANARRLVRMLGRDFDGDLTAARALADYFAYAQFDTLQRALLRVLGTTGGKCDMIVAAGVGHFLAERLAAFNGIACRAFASLFELDNVTPHDVATCAPAAAVAALRRER